MIKQTLFKGWHFMRLIRLSLGVFIAIQAIQTYDALSGLIAAFFLFQTITDTGCCGVNSYVAPLGKNNPDKIEDVEFEELKIK